MSAPDERRGGDALRAGTPSTAGPSRACAVALAYAPTDAAPRVVAKGRGLLAEEIIARARAAGVFVHESPALVSVLAKLDLDAHIPPALYLGIAEILAWVHRADRDQAEAKARSTLAPIQLP